ncbi:MAG TPA: hypothetical protein DCQ50_21170 [Chryseobacterium sp.]|nr:hypothetical protein [Chryseobacterium sp.]
MQSIETNIVWISDIHLKAEYALANSYRESEKVEILFNSLVEKIASAKKSIDYIILSGDIGFKGAKEDYQYFWEVFVKKLYEKKTSGNCFELDKTKILTIPGNHDISWKNVKFLNDYISGFDKHTGEFPSRKSFFNDSKPHFINSFAEYSAFFGKDHNVKIDQEIWDNFFRFDPSNFELIVDPDYDEKRLYGLLVDYQKEIIFVLLNTAWFSIGDFMNQILVTENVENLVSISKRTRSQANEQAIQLLDIKSKIVEFGNQVAGAEQFPFKKLKEYIANNPKFPIVTIAHHPSSWLSWSELYSLANPSLNTTPIAQIFNCTDILLTGHEHVPINKRPEKELEGLLHLKAGMLMEDDITKEPYFQHSRFSMLTISNTYGNCNVKEDRFLLSNKDRWELFENFSPSFGLIKKEFLCSQRKKLLESKFQKFKLLDYLMKKTGVLKNAISDPDIIEETDFTVHKIISEDDKTVRHCFLIKNGVSFFANLLNQKTKSGDICILADLILQSSKKHENFKIKIQFIFLDILVSNEQKKLNGNTNELNYHYTEVDIAKNKFDHSFRIELLKYPDTIEIYSNIVKLVDQKFNNFRNIFFEKYEKDFFNGKGEYLDITKKDAFTSIFTVVSNISFLFDVINYWTLEKYVSNDTNN